MVHCDHRRQRHLPELKLTTRHAANAHRLPSIDYYIARRVEYVELAP